MIEFFNSHAPLFKTNNFSEIDDFLNYSGGEIVSRPGKRIVRTLYLGDQKFFIKQVGFEGFKDLFRCLRKHSSLHTSLFKESCIIDLCQQAGIPVMDRAVFVEKFKFGIPIAGALIICEVKGIDFYKAYNESNHTLKRRLFKSLGILIASMHDAEIDSIVRSHDLLVVDRNCKNIEKCLTLIDREHGKANAIDMNDRKCSDQLVKMYLKSLNLIKGITSSSLLAFLSGYFKKRSFDSARCATYACLLDEAIKKELELKKYPKVDYDNLLLLNKLQGGLKKRGQ